MLRTGIQSRTEHQKPLRPVFRVQVQAACVSDTTSVVGNLPHGLTHIMSPVLAIYRVIRSSFLWEAWTLGETHEQGRVYTNLADQNAASYTHKSHEHCARDQLWQYQISVGSIP